MALATPAVLQLIGDGIALEAGVGYKLVSESSTG